MRVRELKESLELELLTGIETLDREIEGVYSGDLLSWVMSHAKSKDAWVTVRTHINIVAVAVMSEISCIIIADNIIVEDNTIKKATHEGVAILRSVFSVYDTCCRIYDLINKD